MNVSVTLTDEEVQRIADAVVGRLQADRQVDRTSAQPAQPVEKPAVKQAEKPMCECVNCGDKFPQRGQPGRYCCKPECKKVYAREWARAKAVKSKRQCARCGADVVRNHRYCSNDCAVKHKIELLPPIACVSCGKEFKRERSRERTCTSCRAEKLKAPERKAAPVSYAPVDAIRRSESQQFRRATEKRANVLLHGICERCGTAFLGQNRGKRFCDQPHCERARNAAANAERRAREAHPKPDKEWCNMCGDAFTPQRRDQLTCLSDVCQKNLNLLRQRRSHAKARGDEVLPLSIDAELWRSRANEREQNIASRKDAPKFDRAAIAEKPTSVIVSRTVPVMPELIRTLEAAS